VVSRISFHDVAANNSHLVELLPSADLIIALDKAGNVVEQGTFEKLNVTQGYVHSLSINNTNTPNDYGNDSDRESNDATLLKKFELEPAAAIDSTSDSSRQNGDISVYKYYFDTVGMWWCGLFFATLAAFAFFYVFSSKSKQPT
jgi:ATP-binding cassette, subfamily C (CFTR/MRP), member 1